MIWFRSKLSTCALLALFALAFQMAVAFGHMHRDDLGLLPLPAAGQIHFTTATTQVPAGPSNRDQQPASDDYCPICASMMLIATAIPAPPPVLLVPAPIERVWLLQTPARSVTVKFALSFQARAPPIG